MLCWCCLVGGEVVSVVGWGGMWWKSGMKKEAENRCTTSAKSRTNTSRGTGYQFKQFRSGTKNSRGKREEQASDQCWLISKNEWLLQFYDASQRAAGDWEDEGRWRGMRQRHSRRQLENRATRESSLTRAINQFHIAHVLRAYTHVASFQLGR